MSKNSNNSTNPARTNNTVKGRRGPKPIMTVGMIREQMLRELVSKEMKKIDRKIATETRKRSVAQRRVNDANATLDNLNRIRAEFLAESGLLPKA